MSCKITWDFTTLLHQIKAHKLTGSLYLSVVVRVDAHLLLLEVEGVLAVFKGAQFVVRL